MTEVNRKIVEAACNEYGFYNETYVAIEELSELTKTLTKRLRTDAEVDDNDILEEVADVVIAISCIMEMLDISEEDLNDMIKSKQLRTLRRIYNCEEYKDEDVICTINNFEDFAKFYEVMKHENSKRNDEAFSED